MRERSREHEKEKVAEREKAREREREMLKGFLMKFLSLLNDMYQNLWVFFIGNSLLRNL